MSENPYEPPSAASAIRPVNPSTLLWSVVVVFGCAGMGGVVGLAIGAVLGAFVPGYYRSVFRGGAETNFDPVAVGIGQGLTQGVVFGGIVGLVLVAMWYWHLSRRVWRDRKESMSAGPPTRTSRRAAGRPFIKAIRRRNAGIDTGAVGRRNNKQH